MKYIYIILFFFCFANLPAKSIEDVHAEVTKLVKHLHTVNGNFTLGGAPKVLINEKPGPGASYNPKLHRLSIDLKVYNICQSFGDQATDALAFIIGHEMAHCYMEHHFFSKFNNYHKCNGSELSPEKGADIYGLFNAYVAGYKSFDIVPEVISEIYKGYRLKDNLKGYPSKQERINIGQEVQTQIQELIAIYESANYLSAIGEYDLAATSYEYILKYYQGREVYNNLGVNYALEAIYFTDKDHDLYLYPLEIDWDTRIKKPKSDRGEGDLTEEEMDYRMAYLTKAKKMFEKAGRMDQSYYTADINIICVLTLMKEYEQAVAYYQQTEKSKKTTMYSVNAVQKESARLAMANAKANMPSKKEEADRIFAKLMTSENTQIAYQARYNQRILEEGKCGAPEDISCFEPITVPDYVDNVRTHRYRANTSSKELSDYYKITIDHLDNSTVYQYLKNESVVFTFQKVNTKPSADDDLLDTVEKGKIINSTDGYFIVCEDNRSVFYMSSKNKLNSWGKYY